MGWWPSSEGAWHYDNEYFHKFPNILGNISYINWFSSFSAILRYKYFWVECSSSRWVSKRFEQIWAWYDWRSISLNQSLQYLDWNNKKSGSSLYFFLNDIDVWNQEIPVFTIHIFKLHLTGILTWPICFLIRPYTRMLVMDRDKTRGRAGVNRVCRIKYLKYDITKRRILYKVSYFYLPCLCIDSSVTCTSLSQL